MKARILFILSLPCFVSLMLCCSSCQKSLNRTIDDPTDDSTITDTTYFIDITLDGKWVFEIAGKSDGSGTWGDPWFITGDTSIYPYSSLKSEFDAGALPGTHGLYFSKNEYGQDMQSNTSSRNWWTPLLKQTFADSFFSTGSYQYATLTNSDTTYTSALNPDPMRPRTQKQLKSGIHLIWFDETGKAWQTCSGTAIQTGSYFTITKNLSRPFTFEPGYADYAESTTVTANFECILYDNEGHSIHLTNGKFRLLVRFKQFN